MFSNLVPSMLIVILFVIYDSLWLVNGECSYTLHREDETDLQPLYFILKKDNIISWIKPQRTSTATIIPFKIPEKLIIACPVQTKEKRIIYKDMKIIYCNGYNTTTQTLRPNITTSNGEEDAKPYSCDKQVHFIVKKNHTQDDACLGTASEIGVQISFAAPLIEHWSNTSESIINEKIIQANKATEWKKLLYFCWTDNFKGNVYTMHTIDGKVLYAAQETKIPDFFFDMHHADTPQKVQNLAKIYDKRLQKIYTQTDEIMITNYFDIKNKYLIPRTLIPENDMLFVSWKYATRFYHITAPMWLPVTQTWNNIEQEIRTAAFKLDRELIIYTGTYIKHGSEHEITYLEEIPIPHLFWKLVHDVRTEKAIAFITSNIPYRYVERICEDICQTNLWRVENNVTETGDTYCCDAIEFLRIISFNENILKNVNGTLKMPQESTKKPFYRIQHLGIP